MGRLVDLTGQKFGRLTVIERDTTVSKPGAYWKCVCECGVRKTVKGYSLRTGATLSCGCYNREIVKNKKCAEDLTGREFGNLVVIEQAESKRSKSGQKKARWICKCKCGNTTEVNSQDLKSGHTKSCGCLPTKSIGDGLNDLTGKKFGFLTVISRTDDYVGRNGNRSPRWLCQCSCGNEIAVQGGNLRSGAVTSCGCQNQSLSRNEAKITQFLLENNIKHAHEYYFDDLRSESGKLLRFDFALFNEKNELLALIEHQGEQHYRPHGSFGWFERECSDAMKREYCKSNNIRLFEIRYDEDLMSACENILEKLKNA